MATGRSFAEFVKNKCYNGLYQAAEDYVNSDWQSLNLYARHVHRIGEVEFIDADIKRVYVRDLPGMRVAFEVGLELEIEVKEGDYHYDNSDTCYPWVRVCCEGDLACGLDDWEIISIAPYNPKNAPLNSLSDALVPFVPFDRLEDEATAFLKEFYPEALKITSYGQKPVTVQPDVLAKRLGLNILMQRIREDGSVYGQLYFVDTDAEMYDAKAGTAVTQHIPGKTIVVDPYMFLLRTIGCANNTIIHECVHWVKHRKVFELEKLYNDSASCISCEVVGGAAAAVAKKATEIMERQANQLAPRIQMPAGPFRAKAKEYISRFMRELGAGHESEIMEQVIEALGVDFVVSRQAAKIRLVELGFDQAIGTYTYLDGHYVKPHGFKKGSIKSNQTFSLSAQDAAIERFANPELRKLTDSGDYLFIDNHYVYNAPLYVQPDEDGRLDLTEYARSHMDECCLVFDMTIKSKVGADYHTACFLNREPNDIEFELKYNNQYAYMVPEAQAEYRKKVQAEELAIRRQMTDDQAQCMKLLLDWKKIKYTELGDAIGRDPKTISRIANGETKPNVTTAALICFGLKLSPVISDKLMEVFGCKVYNSMNPAEQWINEALHVKYPEPLWAVQEYLAQYDVTLE